MFLGVSNVWHPGLLYKVKTKLPHNFHCILNSNIWSRQFQIKFSDAISRPHPVGSGVSQGSVLQRLLCLMFRKLENWRIEIHTMKFVNVTFSTLKSNCPPYHKQYSKLKVLNALECFWTEDWYGKTHNIKNGIDETHQKKEYKEKWTGT